MVRRKYTILIIPSGKGRTFRLTTDSIVMMSIAVSCAIFVAVTAFLSYDYFVEQLDRSQLAELEKANRSLVHRLDDIQVSIAELGDRYANIVDREKAIRRMFDLPAINEQERQLGIGGPDLVDISAKSVPERLAIQTQADVERLARLSSFETRQFKEIYEVLVAKKQQLDHTPSIAPCKGYETRGFGVMPHPITGFRQMHAGIDIANRTGTPIYATAAGVVAFVGGRARFGTTIEIDHGNGLKTVYAHLNKCLVKRGQKVRRGDKIAEMGNTGYSTGTHLHYAVTFNGQAVDPHKYIMPSGFASN